MSETSGSKEPQRPAPLPPESQTDRRLKYGANVALASIVVIVLGGLIVWGSEFKKVDVRKDTTASGLYSLKPQTINLIKDNTQHIKIVSLYTKAKMAQAPSSDAAVKQADLDQQADVVADLLSEYQSKGKNIEVEAIDPVSNPAKVEGLIATVTERYGGEVKKYRDFIDSLGEQKGNPGRMEKLASLLAPQMKVAQDLTLEGLAPQYRQTIMSVINAIVEQLPDDLKLNDAAIKHRLKQSPPDYKGVVDSVVSNVQEFSENAGAIVQFCDKYKDDAKIPENIRKFMAAAITPFTDMKKAADDFLKDAKNLGELKLDALRDALRQKNPILVEGEKEFKVLSYEQVWKADTRDAAAAAREGKIHPRFAGEQMITTSILALEHPTKLKVCFVRSGGPPLTQMGIPMLGMQTGPFAVVAERLREYNYDVSDKDLTGMWAMQSRGQSMTGPEPSDEEIKDAIWVVVALPSEQNPMMGGPPPTIAPKVQEHLLSGGSAMILTMPGGDKMASALHDYGIEVQTDYECVHRLLNAEGAQGDTIEQAEKVPVIFDLTNYGTQMLAKPLQSLPGVLVQTSPVRLTPNTAGVKEAASLLPIPSEPKSWATRDFATVDRGGNPTLNEAADMTGPLYAGALAEKGNSRVIAYGSLMLFHNAVVAYTDEAMRQRGVLVSRFPGNSELFMNSIFWLSHQEPMIAISPAAMDVSRVAAMSAPVQQFWRVGVLMIGLPGLVLVCGIMVFLSRRD